MNKESPFCIEISKILDDSKKYTVSKQKIEKYAKKFVKKCGSDNEMANLFALYTNQEKFDK